MYMTRLKKCIIPGSFDPFTLGHLDIVKSVWDLFDQVDIIVAVNPDKDYMFTADERVEIIENILIDINNAQKEHVYVHKWNGMLYDFCKGNEDGTYIVKGVRGYDDLVWEDKQAEFNLSHNIKTIYVPSIMKNVSSTIIRDSIKNGNGVWKEYVHPTTIDYIEKKNH